MRRIRKKVITVNKIPGTENESDVCTKAVEANTLKTLLPRLALRLLTAAGLVLGAKSSDPEEDITPEDYDYYYY